MARRASSRATEAALRVPEDMRQCGWQSTTRKPTDLAILTRIPKLDDRLGFLYTWMSCMSSIPIADVASAERC